MKTKKVVVKTKEVVIQYGGQRRSIGAIQRLIVHQRNRQISAIVPPKIKELLIEQARIEGLNMSAMIGQVLVNYLLDQGTKIEA